MTLDSLCRMAARCADRSDEFVGAPGDDGETVYQGEAANLFALFRDAINEAYAEIARAGLMPGRFVEAVMPEDGELHLDGIAPDAAALIGVYAADRRTRYAHRFVSRFVVRVPDARPGEALQLRVQCLPGPLVRGCDEPVFSEAAAEPMIYVALAVARLWQAERRLPAAQTWMNEYYRLLRRVRSSGNQAGAHRFPKPWFR